MIKIEMDNGTRNYLVRILNKYRRALKKTNKVTKAYKVYEEELIDDALCSLLGKEAKIELDKNDWRNNL